MERLLTRLEGPLLIRPAVHSDNRGFFQETYRQDAYAALGIDCEFVQDNHSRSARGIVRGMHFQIGKGQAKLVRAATGTILDVVVDVRRGSPTHGQWESFELSDENFHQLFVPVGFAHGFCVTSDVADVVYKCSSYYDGATERGFKFDDPEVAIEWPAGVPLVPSERDQNAPLLAEIEAELPFVYLP